jgi:regulator of sirC expression with transglutaminase-like and TPR domain
VDEPEARARFAELMAGDDHTLELDRAALAIARGEYARLEPAAYLRRLDEMAAELRPHLSPEESPERLIAVLNAYLFGEQAFHGNANDYYDPRNSYLNDVLDRRTGIPITLSVVYIEVARRVGLYVEGVGLPGHFIVRAPAAAGAFSTGSGPGLLVDPFNQGAVLSEADCADRIRQQYGNSLRFTRELLRGAGRREIISRMLGNLKGCYLRRGDLERARRAVEWGLLADPAHQDDLRELGLMRYRGGDLRGAIADLERYLERNPAGPLAEQTRDQLRHVEALWARRN